MPREITIAEARQLLVNSLAAARLEAPHQTAALTQLIHPLAIQIIANLISQAYNNGWKDGEERETVKHTYDSAAYFAQTKDQLSRPDIMPGVDAPDSGAADALVFDSDTETRTTDRLNHL